MRERNACVLLQQESVVTSGRRVRGVRLFLRLCGSGVVDLMPKAPKEVRVVCLCERNSVCMSLIIFMSM